MSALTTNQGVRYAAGGDAPDLLVISKNLAEDLERLGVMRFANASDRAKRLPNPDEGMHSWIPGGVQVYFKGEWIFPGRSDFSLQAQHPPYDRTNEYVDFTAAAWPSCSIVVPPSGRFEVVIGAVVRNGNTANSTAEASYRLSGGLTAAASDRSSVIGSTSATKAFSRSRPFAGATPGSVVTATPMWFITSGNKDTAYIGSGVLHLKPEA